MRIRLEPTEPHQPNAERDTIQHAVTVEHPCDDLTASFVARLFLGAMVAYGYSREKVMEAMGEVGE